MPSTRRFIGFTIAIVAMLAVISPPGQTELGDLLLVLGGALVGAGLTPVVFTVVWLASGGRYFAVQFGGVYPIRSWVTGSGSILLLAPVPYTIAGTGGAVRRPFVRLPHLATLLVAALLFVGGLLVGIRSGTPLVDGATFGVAAVALTMLLVLGDEHWQALRGSYTGEAFRILDDVRRASALRDTPRVLELTEAVPEGATVAQTDQLRVLRAEALTREERYGEAVQVLGAELLAVPAAAPPARGLLARVSNSTQGDPTAVRRWGLAATLIAAWEAGDEAGRPAETELPRLISTPYRHLAPSEAAKLRSAALLFTGDAQAAYDSAAKVLPRLPSSFRSWPLCTMARAAIVLDRPDEARELLAKARASDPAEPRLKYVLGALNT